MKEFAFYIVPTPIGNLGDITNRAIEVLKMVDVIACEDSRVTQKLLNHFDIKTKCLSYHKFNEKERVEQFLTILKSGKKMALVSDAGTPLFCDPGSVLIEELRKNNITISALPGANAVATFLSRVPRRSEDFGFAGFLPKTKMGIENLFTQNKHTDLIFYESPNRILKTLEIAKNCRKNPTVAIGRELSKVFEEVVIDSAENVIKYYQDNVLKGEIVAMIYRDEKANFDQAFIEEKIAVLKAKNFKAKEIAIILSEFCEINKNDVYKLIHMD